MELHDFPALALIPLLPLLGALINGLFGWWLQRRFGRPAVHIPAVALPLLSFVITVWAFATLAFSVDHNGMLHGYLWQWVYAGAVEVDMAFAMDRLSAVMCLVVTGVGSLIHIYSIGYMAEEKSYWRYFAYLNLFMAAMLILVLGDSFLTMFIGWEGVGLCSYLLIAFWYTDRAKAAAGMKAFIVNRVGDAGFVVGLALLFWGLAGNWDDGHYQLADGVPEVAAADDHAHEAEESEDHGTHGIRGSEGTHGGHSDNGGHGASSAHAEPKFKGAPPVTSLAFHEVEHRMTAPGFQKEAKSKTVLGMSWATAVCLLLFLGATGKSAQLPLYVWLPDAMAGPTPVSALIHAATMVTAGVYMVARLHFLFALSPVAMTTVATVGALTALFAATIGLFQYDIKKVLAYSTISQLGFMFLAVGVGAYWVGIFHLMTHAFFKACLFLGSGSVIMGCHHEQDMRHMGGLRKLMPITAITYLLACCAIAGFPFFSGFFSKDEILWKAFDSGNMLLPGGGLILWAIGATAALCTSYYVFRSYFMTFSGEYRGHAHPHESPKSMTNVLVVLAVLSVIGGFVGLPHLWHLPNYFEHWLEPVFATSHHLVVPAGHSTGATWGLMFFSIVIAFAGFLLARTLYRDATSSIPARLAASPNPLLRGIHKVVFEKYYVDEIYHAVWIRGCLVLSKSLSWFDRNVVDGIVNFCGVIVRAVSWVHGLFDTYIVDGAVNAVAKVLGRCGATLRLLQAGRVQGYIVVAMVGAIALVLLGYFMW